MSCIVSKGDLPLSISWSLSGAVILISDEVGISTAQVGARASFLSIDAVGYRHTGEYTCIARNDAGVSFSSASLKVNGSYWAINPQTWSQDCT